MSIMGLDPIIHNKRIRITSSKHFTNKVITLKFPITNHNTLITGVTESLVKIKTRCCASGTLV